MTTQRITLRAMLALSCLATTLSCARAAVTTHVAVIGVSPWDDVAPALQPRFDLTSTDALGKSLPVTQQESGTRTSLTNVGTSAKVSSGVGSSVAAGAPDVTGSAPAAPTLTSTAVSPLPELAYSSATALFQQVQLINRYIDMASQRPNYIPYLVRVQFTILPQQDAAAFDVYADLHFSPAARSTVRPVLAVPLLVTDAFELSSSTRSVARSLEVHATVEALLEKAGIGAALRTQLADAVTRAGQNINSLVTVGSKDDNTLILRFGRATHSSGINVLFPQNHVVSVLLLVPDEIALDPDSQPPPWSPPPAKRIAKDTLIAVTGTYWATNPKTGARIPLRTPQPGSLGTQFSLPPRTTRRVPPCFKVAPPDIEPRDMPPKARESLKEAGDALKRTKREAGCIAIEPATLVDDGKVAKITIGGFENVIDTQMSAVLNVWLSDDHQFTLRADTVQVDADRRLATFAFPSIEGVGLLDKTLTAGGDASCRAFHYDAFVYHRAGGRSGSPRLSGLENWPLYLANVRCLRNKKGTEPAALLASVGAEAIHMKADGTASFKITVYDPAPPKDGAHQTSEEINLSLTGADATFEFPPGTAKPEKGGWAVSKPCDVKVRLENVSPTAEIILKATSKNAAAQEKHLRVSAAPLHLRHETTSR